MKNTFRFISVLAAAGALLVSCEGPMGPPGTDGTDGKDVLSVCLQCHSTANQNAKYDEYHLSKHYTGNTSARNTKYCARCHTNEGFQEILGSGAFDPVAEINNGTRINCETCHMHTSFEFTGDTVAQVLRTTAPVSLNYDNHTKTTDFGEINNLCVNCHQIRGATAVSYIDSEGKTQSFDQLPFFPMDNTKDPLSTVKVQVGQSFSVHDGNQSNLFAGINGFEYPGKTYTRTWKHSENNCTDCHMNEYNADDQTGGHTLIVNEEACTACHNSDKLTPVQTTISTKLEELANLLISKKLYTKAMLHGRLSNVPVPSNDFFGVLFPGTESATTFGTEFVSANSIDPATGKIIYNNTVTISTDDDYALRLGREWKYGELGAAYNYEYISGDGSLGIHNPTYALQLLQNSIDWLNAN